MDFVLGHFNYWVVISLMMTGLYVVISTGNLVKKLVGLGVFQTSVFQLYITMSKVAGGRPPILESLPEHGAEAQAAHGVEHGAEIVSEISPAHGASLDTNEHISADAHVAEVEPAAERNETVIEPVAVSGDELAETPTEHSGDVEHSILAEPSEAGGLHGEVFDPLMGVVYSNPLPHVLILTAIVVGVATLAVGLALVVRIRESYGSIEETDIDEAEYKSASQMS